MKVFFYVKQQKQIKNNAMNEYINAQHIDAIGNCKVEYGIKQ